MEQKEVNAVKASKYTDTRKSYYERNKEAISQKRKTPENRAKMAQFRKTRKERLPWCDAVNYSIRKCNSPKHSQYSKEGGVGIKFELNQNELSQLWERDNAVSFKKPYLDRDDKTGNYTFLNCRFIEKAKAELKTAEDLNSEVKTEQTV